MGGLTAKQMANKTGAPPAAIAKPTSTGKPSGSTSGFDARGMGIMGGLTAKQMTGKDKPQPTPTPAAKPSPVTTGYDARGMGIMGGLTAKQMANKTGAPPKSIAKPTAPGKPSGSTSGFDARGMGIMGGLTAKQMTGKDKPTTPPKPSKAVPTYTTANGKFSMVPTAGSKVNTAPAKNATPNLVKKAMAGTGIVPTDNNFSVAAGNGNSIGSRIAWAAQTLLGRTMDNYNKWCGRGTMTILRKAQVPGLTPYTGNASTASKWPSAGADAKNLGPIIESLGWVQVPSNESPVNGDIDILGPRKGQGQGHQGHIQVHANGYWWSDTKQSSRLRDQYSWVKFYRHKDAGAADAVGSTLSSGSLDGSASSGPKVTTPKMIQALQRTETKKGGDWKYDESKLFAKGNSVNTTRPLTVKPAVTKTPPKKLTLSDSMGIKVKPTKISNVDTVAEYGADTKNPNDEVTDKPNAGNSVTPVTTKSSDIENDTLEENGTGNSVIKAAAETSNEITKAIDKDAQIAKVTQKTIKALEVQKQSNINEAKAQQLQQEKKQQLLQTNHSVLKEQLRLQTLMQADISSMNKLLKDIRDLAAATAKGTTVNTSTNTPVPEAHKRMKIKDTPEPISMKVN